MECILNKSHVIGVYAQQWLKAKFMISDKTTINDIHTDKLRSIYFEYKYQVDPNAVLESIKKRMNRLN